MSVAPKFADLRAAQGRIQDFVHRTPILTCCSLDERARAHMFFKCENFQRTGAFKLRGACNAVSLLLRNEQGTRAVATHSSGNHGAALALAARLQGLSATVVMPANASVVKQAAVRHYGGEIVWCEATDQSREITLANVLSSSAARAVHPYNDPRVIAGQGTVAMELLAVLPDLDILLVPVGGGGLISGVAIAAAEMAPRAKVIGVEPLGADDAHRSLRAGRRIGLPKPTTVADGLRTGLGDLTFAIIQSRVHDILRVTEDAMVEAMRLIWERMKLVVEPSAAVTLAAVLQWPAIFTRRQIGIILSGGNVDLDGLPWPLGQPQGGARDKCPGG